MARCAVVSGRSNENCPMCPGKARIVHVAFDDSPRLAQNAKTEQEALHCYRTAPLLRGLTV